MEHFSPCAVAAACGEPFSFPGPSFELFVYRPPRFGKMCDGTVSRFRMHWQRMRRTALSRRRPQAMFGITALCYHSISSGSVHGQLSALLHYSVSHAGRGGRHDDCRKTTGWLVGKSDAFLKSKDDYSVRDPSVRTSLRNGSGTGLQVPHGLGFYPSSVVSTYCNSLILTALLYAPATGWKSRRSSKSVLCLTSSLELSVVPVDECIIAGIQGFSIKPVV